MQVDTMVVLQEYDLLTEAEMAKALLDDVGMWCMVNNEYMSTVYPTGIAPAQLIVRREDAPRARQIIATIFVESEIDEEQPSAKKREAAEV